MVFVEKDGELLWILWFFEGQKKVLYPFDFLLRKKSSGSRKGILPQGFSLREKPKRLQKNFFKKGIMLNFRYGFY